MEITFRQKSKLHMGLPHKTSQLMSHIMTVRHKNRMTATQIRPPAGWYGQGEHFVCLKRVENLETRITNSQIPTFNNIKQ